MIFTVMMMILWRQRATSSRFFVTFIHSTEITMGVSHNFNIACRSCACDFLDSPGGKRQLPVSFPSAYTHLDDHEEEITVAMMKWHRQCDGMTTVE